MLRSIFFILIFLNISYVYCCISFYCINSCGSGPNNKGYKLILANNRDEEINRETLPASLWLDIPNIKTPKIYGPLDIHYSKPPILFSTWLGMNEYGNIGNLLFFMNPSRGPNKKHRGSLVGYYLHNNTYDLNAKKFLCDLFEHKFEYKDFNLVLLEMSPENGDYSIFYLNNNNSESYKQLNKENKERFSIVISNSDLEHPFRKVTFGKRIFDNFIDQYAINSDKDNLIDSVLNGLLLNDTVLYPDENLSKFLGKTQHYENITSINADYSHHWPNARTRTRTLILIDYNNVVEYYEYNLTFVINANNQIEELWTSNNFTFKLNPLFLNPKNDNLKIISNDKLAWFNLFSIIYVSIISIICIILLIFTIKLVKKGSKTQKINVKSR